MCSYGVVMALHTSNAVAASGPYREESLHGRDYIVVPLTLVVPGVLDGSNGPILYEEEELSKDPDLWNGIPLIAYHPEITTENGETVALSARDPKVLAQSCIGYNYRTGFRDGALRSEGWFDKALVANYDKRLPEPSRMLPRLINGIPIELSTGLFANNIPSEGMWNNTPYKHIARDYKADHIAILPDQKGACSVKDGCGTGVIVNCKYNYRGRCINCNQMRNCGGEGSHKPGPCHGPEHKATEGHPAKDQGTSHDLLHDQIHEYLTKNPGATPSDLRKALAPKEKFDVHNPLKHSVHKALVAMRDAGRIKVAESRFGEPKFHANCGGKGGKPGPCPKGSTASGGSKSKPSTSKTASKTPAKSQTAQKTKAFRNPAEANKLSAEADKASAAANIRMPTPSKKEGGVGVVPHETAMKEYKAKQEAAATAHAHAALAHQKLASSNHPNSARHSQISEHHHEMAKKYKARISSSHNRSSTTNYKGSTMKETLIKWLTVNCDCWKNKEKLLGSLTDEELKELKNQGIAKRITNAAAANFSGAFNVNAPAAADGEGDIAGIDYPTLAEFFQIDVDPSKDPVGFTKALKDKLTEVLKALTDPGDPEDAPPPKGDSGADEAAETPTTMADPENLNEDGDCGPNGKKDPNMNRTRKLTPAQFKEMMPEEYRDAWTDFVTNQRSERQDLLKVIANGLSGNERIAIINAHKGMKIQDLRVIAKRMGGKQTTNRNGIDLPEDALPVYGVGSGYNPNNNAGAFDENDIFEVPTNKFTKAERFGKQKPNRLVSDFDVDDG